MRLDFKPNEVAIKVSDSRYLNNGSSVDGKFVVTNQRCYFANHTDNGSIQQMEILPDTIQEVLFFKSGMFKSDGLEIILNDGLNIRFTMKNRNDIGKLINKMY